MKDIEFHFALEGISGKGIDFLLSCIKEVRMFKNARIIDSKNTSWSKLYEMTRGQG
jgi:hypothetical protein